MFACHKVSVIRSQLLLAVPFEIQSQPLPLSSATSACSSCELAALSGWSPNGFARKAVCMRIHVIVCLSLHVCCVGCW